MTASTIPSIGIDFGGTSIKMGVVKGAEVIAHAPSIATQEYGNPDQLIEAIAQFVNMLRLNHPEVQAIGMGMPGFVNFYQGTVYTLTNVPGWNNVPVRDMLQAACGLPVYVENDANCMAYAEWKLGAGKGKRHLVCLTLGTGVAGIAENGATMGKTELAKLAKALNLDAIHDTVHEMARDEARHGKAFAGLLKRYFGE